MQKWKSHKVVEAARILSVVENPSQPGYILHMSGEKVQVAVTPEWVQKHATDSQSFPALTGGYYVRYEDGYTSWSPAAAFEAGYARVTEVSTPDLLALAGEHILQFFGYTHLPERLQAVSRPFAEQAAQIMQLPRNPERTVALRKLLESKDAAVRAALAVDVFQLPAQVGRSTSTEPNMKDSER